jgi:CubicO group peptidase (beta-lactamase class C family)
LNDPVIKHLPYFRLKDPRYKEITVRQMVTHTSGMLDVTNYHWDKPEYDDGALERYVRSLDDKTLRWAPGKEFRYSNMAFEVLGDLVAKVSGKSFEEYVAENILEPVGMKSSTLLYKKADCCRRPSRATRMPAANCWNAIAWSAWSACAWTAAWPPGPTCSCTEVRPTVSILLATATSFKYHSS